MKEKTWKLRALLIGCLLTLLYTLPAAAATTNETENNDTFATADTVAVGNTIEGKISKNGDVDIYKMTLSSSGRVTLKMESHMQYYTIHIYDTDGNQLWYTDCNEWNENVGFRADSYKVDLEKGTYYIKVTGYQYGESWASTGNYTLGTAFTASGANVAEPNNSIAQAKPISFGQTIKGQIALNDRYDFYKVVLSSSGRVTLNMKSYMQYYTLQVYDTDGNQLWYTDCNEWNENVGFRADSYKVDLEKGTYYIKVTGYWSSNNDWDASTGVYTLGTVFTASGANVAEPNNSIAQAKPVSFGQTIKGQIALNDRYDFYKIRLTSKMKLKIAMNSYMQYYTLHIYNPSGKELWSTGYNEWNKDRGRRSDSHYIDLPAGTYYIKVTGYWSSNNDWDASTGNYNFRLSQSAVSMKLNKKKVTLDIKKSYTLKTTLYPKTGEAVTWSSGDKSIATVSSKGVVKAKKTGCTVITAKVGNEVKASCMVYVRPGKTKIIKAKGVTYKDWWSTSRYAELKWKKVKGCSGYQIYQSKYKNKKFKEAASTYSNSNNISVNKKGTYYYKVRAYTYSNGTTIYGKWSNVKKVTIRK